MGQPVVHFEIIGKDGDKLKSYYAELFGWEIDSDNEMVYGLVQRDGNTNADGAGIGGGVWPARKAMTATSPSTSRSPTSRPLSRRPRALVGRG